MFARFLQDWVGDGDYCPSGRDSVGVAVFYDIPY